MFKGFRDFLFRGNVIDLAVAVIIGAAFGAIVTSLVADILTPLIAAVVGKPDFSYLIFNLHGGKIKYGNFLNALITFVLIASAVYFVVVVPSTTLLARIKRSKDATPTTKKCPECLSEIPIAARRCAHCGQPVAVLA